MAATVQIPTPVLQTGEYFQVRYRPTTGGAWVTVSPNPTNAPFTIPVTSGTYIVEARAFVNGSLCPPTTFEVAPACDCPDEITAELIRNTTTQTDLKITFSSVPACGFVIHYGTHVDGNGSLQGPYQVVNVPNPTGGVIQFPVTGDAYNLIIEANCCDGRTKYCQETVVRAPVIPPEETCKRWDSSPASPITLEYVAGTYRLKIVREMPPSPTAPTQCETLRLQYMQLQTAPLGTVLDNGIRNLSAEFLFQTVVPNDTAYINLSPHISPPEYTKVQYHYMLYDCCNSLLSGDTAEFDGKTGTPL